MTELSLGFIPSVEDMANAIDRTKALIDDDPDFRRELDQGRPSGNPIQLGPRLPSADDWAEAQVKGAKDNAAKWLKNTLHPKKNFKEEALRDTSVARFHDSMETVLRENRWEGGMANVNESEALATVERMGTGVYTAGIEKRLPKIRASIAAVREDRLALAVTIDSLPVATEADREAKMIANVRGLKAIGARRRGSS